MRDMLGLLKIRYRDISYVIKLFSKYTVITGFSGTGKSELVRLVEDAIVERVQSKNPETFSIQVLSNLPFDVVDSRFNYDSSNRLNLNWMDAFKHRFRPKSIICMDEDFLGLQDPGFQNALTQFDALFIIVCRDSMKFLPYGVEDVYRLQLSETGNYHYNKPLLDTSKSDLNFLGYQTLYTEDSGSGNKFFKNFLDRVESSKGKSNVLKLTQNVRNSVFCVDGLGFGCEYLRVIQSLRLYAENHNALWVIDSFESLILNSEWFRYSGFEYTYDYTIPNLEKQVTETLRDILEQNHIRYTKSRLSECFVKDCCSKPCANTPKFKCGLYCQGDKLELILGKKLLYSLISAFGDARVKDYRVPALVGSTSQHQHNSESTDSIALEYEEISDEEFEDEKDSSDDLNTDLFTSVF